VNRAAQAAVDVKPGDPLQHRRGGGVDGHAGIQAGRQRIAAGGVHQHRQRLVAGADGALRHDVALGDEHPTPARRDPACQLAIAQAHEGCDPGVTGIVDRHPGHGRMVSPAGAGRKGCVGAVRTTGR
jgi:hypothetical protein